MVVVNPRGEIVLLNLQAEKQFGYRRDELIGQQVTSIIPQGFTERADSGWHTHGGAALWPSRLAQGSSSVDDARTAALSQSTHAESTRQCRGYTVYGRHSRHQLAQTGRRRT
jgi:PAS domain-containing protein